MRNKFINLMVSSALVVAGVFSVAPQALAFVPIAAPATGGGNISADTAAILGSGTFTTLNGPVLLEGGNPGAISVGDIIITAPAGFEFDSLNPATVMIAGDPDPSHNINLLPSGTVVIATTTANTITFQVTHGSSVTGNFLNWQNIRIRPTLGAPLTTGQLQISYNGLANQNVGTITKVHGAISATHSTAVFSNSGQITVNGGTATFDINLKDQFDNPVAGQTVTLSATGSGNSYSPISGVSDGNGHVQLGLQSTVAQTKTVSILAGAVTLSTTFPVTFISGSPAEGLISASTVNPEASLAGTTVNLTITVKDGSGNPVSGYIVPALNSNFGVVGSLGTTDNSGIVHTTLIGTNKGTATLTFSSGITATGDTTIHFIDTTIPVITVTPPNPATVEYKGIYNDAGATALDNIDGNITGSITATNPVDSNTINVVPNTTTKVVGVYTVTYNVTDGSGNHATPATRTVNVLDTTAPIISSITSDATAAGVLKIGDTVTFTVTPSTAEPNGSVSGSYNGVPLTWSTSDGGVTYTATYTVVEGNPDQTSALQISGVTMTDEAGNVSSAAAGTDVVKTIDATRPVLSTVHITSNNANPIWAKVGDTVTLTFTSDENIQTPTVTIAGNPTTVTGSGTSWTATYIMAAGDSEGVVPFSVTFADVDGNTAAATATVTTDSSAVTFDKTNPTITGTTFPAFVNLANQASIPLTGTATDNNQVVSFNYDLSDGPGHVTGTGSVTAGSFNQSINASALTDGALILSLTVTDQAGNVSSVTLDNSTKDTVPPVVTPVAVTPSTGVVGIGGTVTVTLTAGQNDLAVVPGCTVNGIDVTSSFVNNTDNTYTLVYNPALGNVDRIAGTLPISCTLQETSGNTVSVSAFDDSNTLVIDVTPPPAPVVVSPADGSYHTTVSLDKIDWTDVTDASLPVTYVYQTSNTSSATNPDGSFVSPLYTSGVLTTSEIPTPATPEGVYYWHVRSIDNAGNIGAYSATYTVTVDNTAPVLTLPSTLDNTFEATGPVTTPTLSLATALDNFDPSPVVTYVPNPASFNVGSHTVTWTATDAAGNSSSGDSTVVIQDTIAPVIASHGDETMEATGPSGAVVTYTLPVATDIVDGTSDVVTCLAASGSTFPVGVTVVYCNTVDVAGNPAVETTFNVTVTDLTPPTVSITPSTQTLEATGPSGATASYTATATDIVDGSLTPVCSQASGSTFALGDTPVTCTSTDAHSNTGTATAHVIVVDTTAPSITAPADVVVVANTFGAATGVVVGTPVVSDIVDPAPVVTNDHVSTTYPMGVTTVTWTATDFSTNHASATQHITVVPGPITKLIVTALPTSVTTANSSTITVMGEDQYSNVVTNNSSAVVALSADNGGALDSTILTLTNGVVTTGLSKATVGDVHVTATSGVLTPGNTTVTFTPADVTAPTVIAQSPAQGATGVALSAPLFVTFSEPLKSTSINSTNVQLWEATSSGNTLISATVSLVSGDTQVNVMPNAPLSFSTSYYFVVSGVQDVAGNPMASSYDTSGNPFTTVADTADHTAPTVTSQFPLSATSNSLPSVQPSVYFSEAMDITTLTSANVQVRRTSDDFVVPATVVVANGGTQAIIQPTSPLGFATGYYIWVSTAVTDLAGNHLASDYFVTSFNTVADTADHTAPTVTAQSPVSAATGVAMAAQPYVDFSEAMDLTTLTSSTIQLVKDSTSGVVPAVVVVANGGTRAIIEPNNPLDISTAYHVVVTTTVKDVAGNALASTYTGGSFTTAADTSVLGVTGVTMTQTFATPDNSFADGWKWQLNVTAPTAETKLQMKFTDFLGTSSSTISASTNIRFYSPQSSDHSTPATAVVYDTASVDGTGFSLPLENLNADLDAVALGRQFQVFVEVRVPVSTAGGSYSGSYGIQTTP